MKFPPRFFPLHVVQIEENSILEGETTCVHNGIFRHGFPGNVFNKSKGNKGSKQQQVLCYICPKVWPEQLPIGFGSNSNLVSGFKVQDLWRVWLSLMFRFEAAQSLLSIFGFNPTLIQCRGKMRINRVHNGLKTCPILFYSYRACSMCAPLWALVLKDEKRS